MNGPRRPVDLDVDPEGWVEASIGALYTLRRQCKSIVQTVPDQSAWAESDVWVDALLGLVALAGSFENVVEILAATRRTGDLPPVVVPPPATEDLLR